jgi:hypothetical protein
MTASLPSATAVPSLRDLFNDNRRMRADISNSQYHSDRSCVSVSGLKQLLRSPAHFRAYLDGQRKETPAMFFGTAVHSRLLEPKVFATDYVLAPTSDKRSTEYKEFQIANADKLILTAEQMATLEGMERAAHAHTSLNTLLRAGLKEQTIIWQDEATGIWLKIRPDCLCIGIGDGNCLDLKSTEDASVPEFSRTCVNYHYDLQAAVYLSGLRAVFGRDFDFCFGAIEKSEPYGVALYGAPEEMLSRGERRFRQALNILKHCRDTDTWPSYQPHGAYDLLEWPRWAA